MQATSLVVIVTEANYDYFPVHYVMRILKHKLNLLFFYITLVSDGKYIE